ncbi:MAG: glucosaminidase domain-containing protein [Proteobacteria bacterium]|nr:glucosaminidase domain-containing protein [Pseudomonadota bacterium]
MSKAPMKTRQLELLAAAVTAVAMIVLMISVQRLAGPGRTEENIMVVAPPIIVFPDFAGIPDVLVKKQQFFDFLEDYIITENTHIRQLREQLLKRADIVNDGIALSSREREWMLELAQSYGLEVAQSSDREIANELVLRVDVIPVSLALAQAANESAWGTSRFVLEGYNLFGQWCYEEGCGMVPQRRISGATHEVRRFDSIAASVKAYLNNINSHHLYAYLRELRAFMRNQQQTLDPMVLAYGLGRYSERGEHYVDEIQNIIIQNKLRNRDQLANSIASIDPLH